MTTIPQLPVVAEVGSDDLLPLSQGGVLYAATVEQIVHGLQSQITLSTGGLLGRVSAGAGGPETIGLGNGLSLVTGSLTATGGDHAAFPVQATMSLTDQVVLNANGKPSLLALSALRGLFNAGAGITIDSGGAISATVSSIAGPAGIQGPAGSQGPQGPAGPQGPKGSGLTAPSAGNSAASINAGDYIAIWQNGGNGWITYQQLIGGQTIDQLPSAGPAQDSDQILVAQSSNSLSSQSFAAIWAYTLSKLPTVRKAIVEIVANTVLDGTSHNSRVLVASQPLTLSANFANMGSGFCCKLINLSSGLVTMGEGITAGSGAKVLAPGNEAVLTALTYSGGSIVWWDGGSTTTSNVPSLTVAPISDMAASASFSVSGNIYNDTPSSLDYSLDGTNWTLAPSPLIGSTSYSFQAPGLSAGTYVLHVRDHGNVTVSGTSNSFVVGSTDVTLGTAPSSAFVGVALVVSGTVTPPDAAVQVGFSTSATAPPAVFSAASVTSGQWSATVTPGAVGTAYLWAEQINNPASFVVSPAVSVAMPTLTLNVPSSAEAGSALSVTGTVAPANSTVTVQLAAQNTAAPNGAGTPAAVSGNSFSATLTPAGSGTMYVWAEDQSTNLSAVSGVITVTAAQSVSYTINQPATTSYAHGSGTIAVNGAVNPAQVISTQVALSTSNTSPPATGWQPASIIDNNTVWALYLTTPAEPGAYYVWVEAASGAGSTVSEFTLTVA
jgi:hypothetical protein